MLANRPTGGDRRLRGASALAGIVAIAYGCGPRPVTSPGPSPAPGAPAGVSRAALPDGDYACSLTNDGTAYPEFHCRVETRDAVIRLDKLGGSQRVRGTVSFETEHRFGFAGEFYCSTGGCERALDARFEQGSDGVWLGDLGDGASLRLRNAPAGMFGGAGYGGSTYGGSTYGTPGTGGAPACVPPSSLATSSCPDGVARVPDPGPPSGAASVSPIGPIDLAPPPGVAVPTPASRPAPPAPYGDWIALRVRKEIVRQIQILENMLASTRAGDDQAALHWQLAKVYRELMASVTEQGVPGDAKLFQTAYERAVGHLETLRKSYPKFCAKLVADDPARSTGCGDEQLFQLARIHVEGGDTTRARTTFAEIVQSWRESRFVPTAYFALGELFAGETATDPTKWDLAVTSFTTSAQHPPPENLLWGSAHLWLSRARWSRGDFARALAEAKKAIEYATQYASLPGASELGAMARTDLVALYAQTADAKQAYNFFRPLSGDRGGDTTAALAMLEQLHAYYLGLRQYPEAITATQELLVRAPTRDPGEQCERLADIALVTRNDANKNRALPDLRRLLDAAATATEASARAACAPVAISTVVEVALAWDAASQRGDSATAALAGELYDAVIAGFSDAEIASAPYPRLDVASRPTRATLIERRAALGRTSPGGCSAAPAGASVDDVYRAALCQLAAYDAAHPDGADRRGLGRLTGEPAPMPAATRALTTTEQSQLDAIERLVCAVQPTSAAESVARMSRLRFARARIYLDAGRWLVATAGFRELAFAPGPHGAEAAPLYLEALHEASLAATPVERCGETLATEATALIARHCTGDGTPATPCARLAELARAAAALPR